MKKFIQFLFVSCVILCGLFTLTQFDSIYATGQVTGQIQGAANHSIALKEDGTVWTWGYNYYGELGDGTNTERTTPKKLESISNVKAIAAGYYHNLALKTDGTLWAWGQNEEYQLGDGTRNNRNVPVQVFGIDNIKIIAAGNTHSLVLKEDGTVWAWGTNYSGQLGDGTTISRGTPAIVPGLTSITAIAASNNFSFALKSDGTLWGWGYNCQGELGVGTDENVLTPTQVLTNVKTFACGYETTYAVTNDGAVWAWGYNSNGELGLGYSSENVSPNYTTTPTRIPTLSNVTAIYARGLFAVAQKADGTLWAWGMNDYGQVGDGTTVDKTSPTQLSGLANVISINCGIDYAFALTSDNLIYAWGSNGCGKLGDGTTIGKNTPTQITNFSLLADPVTATAGDGKVLLTWNSVPDAFYYVVKRSNNPGGPYTTIASPLYTNTYTDTAVFNDITYYYIVTVSTLYGEQTIFQEISTTPHKVIFVMGGGYHSLAVMRDHTAWVWGDNEYGQLGDYTKLNINTCERLEDFSDVKAVAASEYYSIALKTDGTVWGWGKNNYGQLGDGSTSDRTWPGQVRNISDVKAITTGRYFSAALKNDGTVWAWGDNTFGQLGDGTTTRRITPVQVSGLTNVTSIAAGEDFIFAIRDDGTLWAWGRNEDSEICDAASSYVTAPLLLSSISSVKAVACGVCNVYAIKTDGSLWAWGDNSMGQVGIGTTDYIVRKPMQVSGVNNVSAISAGACYAVALLNDGTVWAWGRNDNGQLGIGTTVDRNTPAQVTGLNDILTIGCGYYHALAYQNNGDLFAWGANWVGELGDGTNTGKLTPVHVPNVGLLSLPADPRNLTARVGNNKALLTWEVATGADSYNIKRALSPGGPYATIASTFVTGTSFTDTGVINDTTYYYKVTSVNRDGESAGSNVVSAIPNANKPLAPANLTAETGYNTVILRWDSVAGAYTYCVKRSDFTGGQYSTITSNLTQTTYTDTGLTTGNQYYYIVTAVNDNGEGPASNEVSATPAVPKPSNLTATAGNSKVTLGWTRGTGVTWTRVKRATAPGGPYVNLVLTSGSTYDDTGVTVGTSYYYIVVSVINSVESAASNEVSAIPYSAPTNLTATAGNARVTLTWSPATGSSYYNVKRATTAGGPYIAIIANITGTTYDDTTAVNGTTYYYVVTTLSGGAERASNEASATPSGGTYEPNDSMGTASVVANNVTLSSTIYSSSDVDYFKFTLSRTSNCTVTLTPPSNKDYDLYLYNSSGSQIGSSVNGTGMVDTISQSSLAAGTYYVKVIGYGGAYSTTAYTLKITSN